MGAEQNVYELNCEGFAHHTPSTHKIYSRPKTITISKILKSYFI